MRRKTKIMIALGAVCASTLALAACGSIGPYDDLAKDGYTVSVCYDPSGGDFAQTPNVNFIDVYELETVQKGVKLLEPNDPRRGSYGSDVTRSNYMFFGWYQNREPRTDENGTPLDEDGLPCTIKSTNDIGEEISVSVSGKEQGYIYSDPWDFENDVFQLDDYEYESGKFTKTLYAAWGSYMFAVYDEAEDLNGNRNWTYCGASYFSPEYSDGEIEIPKWTDEGKMEYGNFPRAEGKTFISAYADENKTQPFTDFVKNTEAVIDYEHGIFVNSVVHIYANWRDGTWYRVKTADQFIDNAISNDACFEVLNDLDFTGKNWVSSFSTGNFTGKIVGENGKHVTFSNIDFTQDQRATGDSCGGLFGRITSETEIRNVSFENVTYRMNGGARSEGAYFGLFAGTIAEDAKLENISVTGQILIGEVYLARGTNTNVESGYDVGLVSGNLIKTGIVSASVTASSAVDSRGVTVKEDGSIIISYQ